MKSYTDLVQSKKLAKILPFESADNYYSWHDERYYIVNKDCPYPYSLKEKIPCWSLSSLLGVLPEINGIPLTLEKVKAEDGYEGYYYHIEYKDIVLIPYSKNPVDACVTMIEKLHELNLL